MPCHDYRPAGSDKITRRHEVAKIYSRALLFCGGTVTAVIASHAASAAFAYMPDYAPDLCALLKRQAWPHLEHMLRRDVELRLWWGKHKEMDCERERQKSLHSDRMHALGKLTPGERVLLGLEE